VHVIIGPSQSQHYANRRRRRRRRRRRAIFVDYSRSRSSLDSVSRMGESDALAAAGVAGEKGRESP